jgi:hypothetical protein
MTFQIDLHDFDLTDVLQFLLHAKKTGVLHVNAEAAGKVYFADGLVVHAADGVNEGIDALFYMSCMTSGTASFELDVMAPAQTISEETGKLVETIEKRRIEFQKIKERMPSLDSTLAKATRELESTVALRRTDWQILALIDGRRKLSQVIGESKLGGYEAMKTVVWLKEKELIYEPEKAARIVSRLVNYANCFFADFGKNGVIWFKRWAGSNEKNKEMSSAISIDEATMEMQVVSDLSSEQIDYFIQSFEAIVNAEGPKIYGKVLFRKKLEGFNKKLKDKNQ